MAEVNVTPELRFPEFNEEWAAKKLGNIFEMKSGSFVPAKEIENEPGPNLYPCYGGNGLRGYTKSFTHEGRYNLIGRQGALCGNINLVSGTFHATEHAVVVANNDNYDIDFVYYILNNLRLNRLATGQAQPGLSISILDSVKFYATKLAEQQKIATFLKAIDQRIQLLQKKKAKLEEYKKGVMQKLFSQEIRFKDENGNDFPDWEEKKLGEIGEFKTSSVDKKIDEKLPMVYLVNYMNVYRHETISNANRDNLMQVSATETQLVSNDLKKGDILFTPSSETPSDIGHSVVIFEDLENTLYSYHLMRFRPTIDIDLMYSHYFCNIPSVLKQISSFATGSTRFTISVDSFSKIQVSLPTLPEQKKIAASLTSLDKSIESVEEEIEGTITFKKGLLQKMFV